MAIEFFNYTDDIRRFAPQIKSDAKLESFGPFLLPVKNKVVNLISQATYDALKTAFDDSEAETSTLGKAAMHLRAAMANFMAIPYFIFEAKERNNTDSALYRYQEDQQKEIYLENAFSQFDELLSLMDANIADFAGYAATDRYKVRETLYLKSPAKFNRFFSIDNSAYFFNNTIFIQEEIINEEVKSRISGYPIVTGDDLQYNLGKAVAYRTVANAILHFDYTELPKGIRTDIQKEASAKKASEAEAKEAFFVRFNSRADEFFLKVERALNESLNDGVFTIPEDSQTEDDKFFFPS